MGRGALTGRPAGQWTDDTDMALCVAQVGADGHRLDGPEGQVLVAEQFLRWYADHPPDVGNQTRAVLSATTDPGKLALAAAKFQRTHPDAAGNGSLMRNGPVALGHLGDDKAIAYAARGISSLTHPHDLAGDACVLWSIAIDRAVREGRLDGIIDGIALVPLERRTFWEETITAAETLPIEKLRPNGYVVTALQAAHRAITSTAGIEGAGRLEAALRQAVAIGDDTDTVAAIAGSLLGACYGASAVPFAWRRRLAGWPPGIGHRDLVAMGILATSRGKPDQAGWPVAEDIAITPNGKTAYVSGGVTHVVIPINTATNTPGPAIPVRTGAAAIAITPNGKTTYVVSGRNSLIPINTSTNTPGPAIPVGTGPHFIAITPNGKTAYVVNAGSRTVTPIAIATVPGKPGAPIATSDNASATLSWTAPTSGGSRITSYTVESTPGAKTCTVTVPSELRCTVSGLTDGISYRFRVTAHNTVGTSPLSSPSNPVTPRAQKPARPAAPHATAGNRDATVTWNAPTSGGSSITRYLVTANTRLQSCVWNHGPLTCTVTGLRDNTRYSFRLVAHNSVGTSPDSAPSNTVTPRA